MKLKKLIKMLGVEFGCGYTFEYYDDFFVGKPEFEVPANAFFFLSSEINDLLSLEIDVLGAICACYELNMMDFDEFLLENRNYNVKYSFLEEIRIGTVNL